MTTNSNISRPIFSSHGWQSQSRSVSGLFLGKRTLRDCLSLFWISSKLLADQASNTRWFLPSKLLFIASMEIQSAYDNQRLFILGQRKGKKWSQSSPELNSVKRIIEMSTSMRRLLSTFCCRHVAGLTPSLKPPRTSVWGIHPNMKDAPLLWSFWRWFVNHPSWAVCLVKNQGHLPPWSTHHRIFNTSHIFDTRHVLNTTRWSLWDAAERCSFITLSRCKFHFQCQI